MSLNTSKGSAHLQFELNFTQRLCEEIDTPRSLCVWMLIKYHQYQDIVDLEINPSSYQTASNFADDVLVTSVLKKSKVLPLHIDRKAVALQAFYKAEELCRDTNERLCNTLTLQPEKVRDVRRIVQDILGPLNRNTLKKIEGLFRHGSGATTGVKGDGSTLSDKYNKGLHLTSELMLAKRAIQGETWAALNEIPIIVPGNKFTTVPKNAKTDRGICVEPTLNIYCQLGIGTYLKRRLQRFGCDLYDQSRNRDLAKAAYSEELATIDLSMASDTLSWSCVLDLVTSDWFDLLNLFRSKRTLLPDATLVELEKFSSMGNGFTFELESLIFLAICTAVVPRSLHHHVSVYGDDIIVPQSYADEVVTYLEYFGFKVNSEKSFLAGSFFESCGRDFFQEVPVRPFYLRSELGGEIPYALQTANRLRVYAELRNTFSEGCDGRFHALWLWCVNYVPKAWKNCHVPESFGDSGLVVSESELQNQIPPKNETWEGRQVKRMHFQPIKKRSVTNAALLVGLTRLGTYRSVMERSLADPEVLTEGLEPRRGYLRKPRSEWTLVVHWGRSIEWVFRI